MAFEQVHQPKPRVRILQLKREFHCLRMKEGESMFAYISRAKIAPNNLVEAGAKVKAEDLAYVLLVGLPDSYENSNMALVNLPDEMFTTAEIKKVLLAKYDRRASSCEDEIEVHKEALQTAQETEIKKLKS